MKRYVSQGIALTATILVAASLAWIIGGASYDGRAGAESDPDGSAPLTIDLDDHGSLTLSATQLSVGETLTISFDVTGPNGGMASGVTADLWGWDGSQIPAIRRTTVTSPSSPATRRSLRPRMLLRRGRSRSFSTGWNPLPEKGGGIFPITSS